LGVPTRSNRNARAWAALLAGLAATAALPASIAISQELRTWKLLAAFAAIPVAAVLGFAAIAFARGARRRIDLTLGRARGGGIARLGRALGLLGIYLAGTGLLTVAVYFVLSRFVQR
jgi:hypothetical protein